MLLREIALFIRIAVIFLGVGFLIPGFLGVFRPEQLAEGLALTPEGSAGLLTVRALIGAPYLAMAATCPWRISNSLILSGT